MRGVDGVGAWPGTPTLQSDGSGRSGLAKNHSKFKILDHKVVASLRMEAKGGEALHESQLHEAASQLEAMARSLRGGGPPKQDMFGRGSADEPFDELPGADAFERRFSSPAPSAFGDVEPGFKGFSSTVEAPALQRSLASAGGATERAAQRSSGLRRGIAALANGAQVSARAVYGGTRFVVGKGAGAVSSAAKFGMREMTHNPIGTLMLILATLKGYRGRTLMPIGLEKMVNNVLQTTPEDMNPLPFLASQVVGKAARPDGLARMVREARHFAFPGSRPLDVKARHAVQHAWDRVGRPVAEWAVNRPLDAAGAAAATAVVAGGHKSKVGHGLLQAVRVVGRVLHAFSDPFTHTWTRRMPRERHWGKW